MNADAGAGRRATSPLPKLVLIPGTLCDARLFARQRRAWRGRVRVEVLDFRGLRDMPGWIASQLARQPARFSVAGFSLGGLMALAMLRAAPERVERLALIASNAEAAGPRAWRRSRTQSRLWRTQGPDAVVRSVMPAYFHHPRMRSLHAALVRDMAARTGRRAALAQFAWAGTRASALETLARSTQPLLVVSGGRDGLCPRSLQQRLLQARPDAQWTEFRRCGHFVPLEAPGRMNRLLLDWLLTPLPINHGDPA